MDNTETINTKLIEYLMTIPFPYSDVIREQINASSFTNSIYEAYYCIHFNPAQNTARLPHCLDRMPLSWQILTDRAPLLCQMFIKEGYIEKLEIMDLALNCIPWELVWITAPLLDYEYNVQHIRDSLIGKEIVVNKILYWGSHIDLVVEATNMHFVASFRECQVRKLISEQLPIRCLLNVEEKQGEKKRFAIVSSNGEIDFKCTLMFIQWNKIIS